MPSSTVSRVESLLPRAVLLNTSLYALVALIYSVAFFTLESVRPGRYVFAANNPTHKHAFGCIAIVSWPLLFFGALILIAVRIGARERRKKRSSSNTTKQCSGTTTRTATSRTRDTSPDSTNVGGSAPPWNGSMGFRDNEGDEKNTGDVEAGTTRKKRGRRRGRKRRVPRGFVALSFAQRMYATVGFVWVFIGLGLTTAAAALVYLGMRERYLEEERRVGKPIAAWQKWFIPGVCGTLVAVVMGFLALTTAIKAVTTAVGRRKMAARRVIETEEEGVLEEEELEDGFGSALPDVGVESDVEERTREEVEIQARETMRRGPDRETVERLLRQMRDLGFENREEVLRALEEASYDLATASDALSGRKQRGGV